MEGYDGYEYYDGQPKWPVRRILKWLFTGISIAVYLIIFIRIFISCDSRITETLIFDNQTARLYAENVLELPFPQKQLQNISKYAQNDGFEFNLYRIDPTKTMDDDGRIQVKFITYLPDADNFQMTLKINEDYYPLIGDGTGYTFVLRKLSGNELSYYTDTYFKTEKRLGYVYLRIAFRNVKVTEKDSLSILMFNNGGFEGKASIPLFSLNVYNRNIFSKRIDINDKKIIVLK